VPPGKKLKGGRVDFTIPQHIAQDVDRFRGLLKGSFAAELAAWHRAGELSREFFAELGQGGWYGTVFVNGRLSRGPALREAMMAEEFAKVSPGAAIAALAHADLGLMG
jgi:alkylation response protein AidB-like acyl-CoA dehydrogenase